MKTQPPQASNPAESSDSGDNIVCFSGNGSGKSAFAAPAAQQSHTSQSSHGTDAYGLPERTANLRRIRELEARVAELEKDAGRLDMVLTALNGNSPAERELLRKPRITREVIDKAMEAMSK